MKRYFNNIIQNLLALVLIVGVVFASYAYLTVPTVANAAGPNPEINYQGKLTTPANVAVADASYNMQFSLYTVATGGTPIWTEVWCFSPDSGVTCNGSGTDSRIPLTSGLFSTMLGSTTPLTSVNFNQPLYLGVTIGGSGSSPSWDPEMTPRKILGSVPAAFVANTLQGLNSAEFLRSDASNATSSANTFLNVVQSGAGKVAEFFGSAGASVLSVLSGGKVGIGSSTPNSILSLSASSSVVSVASPWFTIASTTNGTASTTLFTIVPSGAGVNVGIGTSSPFAPLSVQGNTFIAGGATSTNLAAASSFQLGFLSGTQCLQEISGQVSGTTCGSTFGYPFTNPVEFGTTTAATTTPLWAQEGIYASSTSYFNNLNAILSTTTNATTTNLAITGVTANSLLSVNANGQVVASSTIGNAQLVNNSIIVNTAGPLAGAATVALGGTLNLSCPTCSSSAYPFTPTAFGSINTSATSTTLNDTQGFVSVASSTLALLTVTNGTTTNATTTNLAVTNTITGSVSGNAGTATVLQNTRTINNVGFNGSGNITINAASSTLLGDNNVWASATTTFVGGVTLGNSTTTNATTTSLFSTTASSSKLFSTTANFGALTINSLTGTQCLQEVAGVISTTGSGCAAAALFTYPFTNPTEFGTTTAATTTPLWAQEGIYASSTSYFNNFNALLSTTTSATTTNLAVTGGLSLPNLSVTNAELANSSISGVALGGTLAALTAANTSLTFSGSYTGTAAQTVTLNLGNANVWTASTTFTAGLNAINSTTTNATTTSLFSTTASSTNLFSAAANFGALTINSLTGTQCLQEVGGVIGVTGSGCAAASVNYFTNSGASTYLTTGTNLGIGSSTPWATLSVAVPTYSATTPMFAIGSSTANGTTTPFIVQQGTGYVGIGSSTPFGVLSVQNNSSTTPQLALGFDAADNVTASVNSGGALTLSMNGSLGGLMINNPQPAPVSGTFATNATTSFSVLGATGGNNTQSTLTGLGGIGGGVSLVGGTGGIAVISSVNFAVGGGGGPLNFIGGAGGSQTIADATTNNGGTGGNVTIGAGAGGAAANGPSGNVAGNGGNLFLTGGASGAVSGTLPTLGTNGNVYIAAGIGGTPFSGSVYLGEATSSGASTGSVIFGNSQGIYNTQTNQFGIATNTPFAALSVGGSAYIGGNLTATGTVTFTALTGTQCLHEVSGVVSGTGSDCGSGGGAYPFTPTAFGSTNTSATSTTISDTAGFVSTASSTLALLTVTNGTTTNATSTNFFSTVASSSQLFAAAANFGALTVNSLTGTQCLQEVSGVVSGTGSGCGGGANYFTNSGASTYLTTGTNLGIGSSTPWATLSVAVPTYSATTPMFAIGSSTANGTTTPFIVAANGNVGIGTTSPFAPLSVQGVLNASSSLPLFSVASSSGTSLFSVSGAGDVNITPSTAPTFASSTSAGLNGPASIYVSGRYAYVANFGNGTLDILDVSNPASPVNISSITTPSSLSSVYVSGRYAYAISSGHSTLNTFDVSNPASPVSLVITGSGLNSPQSVYVSGRYAYVASSGNSSLVIFDISNPASPVKVGSTNSGLSSPQSVYVSGRYAYVASSINNSLVIFDISNPASPVNVGSTSSGLSAPNFVYVSGRYAYVTNHGNNSLGILDISNPALPVEVGSTTSGLSSPISTYVSGRYAYVSSFLNNSLDIFDISNPAVPVNVGSTNSGLSNPESVSVSGRYAYVASNGNNSLVTFDLGGGEFNTANIGSLQAGNLQVSNDILAQGQLQVNGGLSVGAGGIFSSGPLSVSVASSTQANAISATFQGNVGIGSSTPGALLAVSASSTSITNTSPWFMIASTTNGTTAATLFTVVANGAGANVGIGTSSPFAPLSVQGNTFITGSATSTNLAAISSLQLSFLSGTQCLQEISGIVSGTTCGGAFGYPFTNPTEFGTTTAATTTPLWAQEGIYASSTSYFNNFNALLSTTTSATTTNLAVTGGLSLPNLSVTNAELANSSISGVALGGTLAALTAANTSLTFSGSYTGTAAQTVTLNLGNANVWTASTTFTAGLNAINATTTSATTTNLNVTGELTLPNTSVTNAELAHSSLAITTPNSTLSLSGCNTVALGGTCTADINLANANVWTASTTFTAGLNAINSTTTNATTTTIFSTTASSSKLFSTAANFGALTINSLTGTQCLHEISGVVSGSGSDCGSGGGSYPFTPTAFGSINTSATSTTINDTAGFVSVASSTLALLTVTNGTTTNATSSNLTVSNIFTLSALTGTQCLQEISGVVSGTGSTCGGGTNYWTSSGGNIFNNTGANVGIGTSSPYSMLSVAGQVVAQNFVATSTTATSTFAGDTTIGSGGSGSATAFVVDYTGNVGVGTSTPFSPFSVVGNTFIGGNLTATGTVQFSAITGSNQCLQVDTNGNVSGTSASCGGASYWTLNGSNIVNNNAAGLGNVGIGSSTPWASLSVGVPVYSATEPMFAIGSSTATGTTTPFIVAANGDVGIGTAAPQWPLHVVSSVTSQLTLDDGTSAPWSFRSVGGNLYIGTSSPSGTFGTSTVGPALAVTYAQGSATGAVGVGSSTPWGKLSVEMGPLNPAFVVSNQGSSTPSFIVTGVNQNGQVGVSTTSPWGLLSINNNIGGNAPEFVVGSSTAKNDIVNFMVANNGGVGIGTTTPFALLSIQASSTAGLPYVSVGSSTNGSFGTVFNILNNGNTGIGTSSPFALLSIQASTTKGIPYFSIGSSTNSGATSGTTGSVFTVLNNGNVGIGTSSPLGFLSIGVPTYSATTPMFVIGSSTVGGVTTPFMVAGNANIGVGSTTPWALFSIQASTTNVVGEPIFDISTTSKSKIGTTTALIVTANGFVGIGTTSPWRALSVSGGVSFQGLTTNGSVQANTLCISSGSGFDVVADTGTCSVSAQRFKQNITPLAATSSLNEVMQLQPVSFYYKPDFNGSLQSDPNFNGAQVGFIADQVQALDPRLVVVETGTTTFEGQSYPAGTVQTVRYENMTALLAAAIQQQQGEILSLESATSSPLWNVLLSATSSPLLNTQINQPFLAALVQEISNYLNSAVSFVFARLQATLAVFTDVHTNSIETQTASVTDGIQMTDQATGKIYCVTIVNGSFTSDPGSCTGQPASSGSSTSGDGSTASATVAPVIVINGVNPAQVPLHTPYSDLGARITGPTQDMNLGITATGTVDTDIVGIYTIIYSATDQSGLTSIVNRTVNVFDPNAQSGQGSQTATSTSDTGSVTPPVVTSSPAPTSPVDSTDTTVSSTPSTATTTTP